MRRIGGQKMPILVLLLLVPLVEIALFVAVGGWIGVWGVLALVVLGALAGVALLRGRLARIPELLQAGGDPQRLLAGGALGGLAALLLIAPGFLTDVLGLVLLLPPVQRALLARLAPGPAGWRMRATVIEGEYTVTDPDPRPAAGTPGALPAESAGRRGH